MTDRTISPAGSPLRRRMTEDMTVRGFTASTQRGYIRAVRDFTAFFGRSPDQASAEDLRRYQLHMRSRGASATSMNAAVSALRFFFGVTLGRGDAQAGMTTVREPRRLPVILSPEEVRRLLDAAPGLKYKAALSLAYGAGLRASEVVSLKVSDIDSERRVIRVEQGNLVTAALISARFSSRPGAPVYVCLTWHTYGEFREAVTAAELEVAACIVWDKGSIGLGHAHYRSRYELIFYVAGDHWYGQRDQADVWLCSRGSTAYVHPTQKPVDLVRRALEVAISTTMGPGRATGAGCLGKSAAKGKGQGMALTAASSAPLPHRRGNPRSASTDHIWAAAPRSNLCCAAAK